MTLTETHKAILERIGNKGAMRDKLGEYVGTRELAELMSAGYLVATTTVLAETQSEPGQAAQSYTTWYPTRRGAVAIGNDPDLIGLA